MVNRSKSPWQAFWITGAVIGTVNVAVFLYILSLPIVLTGDQKFGTEHMDRNLPDWIDCATQVLNLPGAIVTALLFGYPKNASQTLLMIGLAQVIGTLFWACVGVLVAKPA